MNTDPAFGTLQYRDDFFTPNIAAIYSGLLPVLPLAKDLPAKTPIFSGVFSLLGVCQIGAVCSVPFG
jgi:hypothetical protein